MQILKSAKIFNLTSLIWQRRIRFIVSLIHSILKLVRNTLGDKSILIFDGKEILWQDIILLQKLQEEEGLRAATKITKKYIAYQTNKINVKLASQTLSESVSCALEFIEKCRPNYLKSPKATVQFCKVFNDAFDLLNVRSKFSKLKKCSVALTNDNFNKLKNYADTLENYILQLKYNDKKFYSEIGKLGFSVLLYV